MNVTETTDLLTAIAGMYPNANVSKDTIRGYHMLLADIPAERVIPEVTRILTEYPTFMPTAPQLRNAVLGAPGKLAIAPPGYWDHLAAIDTTEADRIWEANREARRAFAAERDERNGLAPVTPADEDTSRVLVTVDKEYWGRNQGVTPIGSGQPKELAG